jgi:hypothetical protein
MGQNLQTFMATRRRNRIHKNEVTATVEAVVEQRRVAHIGSYINMRWTCTVALCVMGVATSWVKHQLLRLRHHVCEIYERASL